MTAAEGRRFFLLLLLLLRVSVGITTMNEIYESIFKLEGKAVDRKCVSYFFLGNNARERQNLKMVVLMAA